MRLQINDLIQVRILEGEVREPYPSRIEDLRENEVIIAWPAEKGMLIPITAGQTLRVSYVQKGRYYGFDGTVRETVRNPFPALILRTPDRPDRIERRDNVRVSAPVPVELTEKIVSLAEYRALGEQNVIRAVTHDISGGGFSIRHGSFISIGMIFDVRMTLPDKKEPLSITAKVVRCVELSDGDDYQVGFSYSQISERDRSRIVRFVFAAQISEMHPPE